MGDLKSTNQGPDPFGKRSLYWAPAQRVEPEPEPPARSPRLGRLALFSTSAPAARAGRNTSSPARSAAGSAAQAPLRSRPRGGYRSGAKDPAKDSFVAGGPVRFGDPPQIGLIELHCSSCDARSEVDLFEYARLHVPFFVWRPGRGFTRWMKCPVCVRRTWVSASWVSWPR